MSEQPGQANTPADTEGEGTVDLGDRVDGGAPAANQRQSEHVHPAESEPSAMTVGAGDPQAPSHPDAGDRPLRTAQSLDGADSPEEQHTDVVASAREMSPQPGGRSGSGDPAGVPVPDEPSPGTSEENGVVQGARTPGLPSTAE